MKEKFGTILKCGIYLVLFLIVISIRSDAIAETTDRTYSTPSESDQIFVNWRDRHQLGDSLNLTHEPTGMVFSFICNGDGSLTIYIPKSATDWTISKGKCPKHGN